MSTPGPTAAAGDGPAVALTSSGDLRRLDIDGLSVIAYPASELEPPVAGTYLRTGGEWTRLVGPGSPAHVSVDGSTMSAQGEVAGIRYRLGFRTEGRRWVWTWAVDAPAARTYDLVHLQDIALAPYGAVRTNEAYVAQYLDVSPISSQTGTALAIRQNIPGERAPWAVVASTVPVAAWCTDALQVMRAGRLDLSADLPGTRLQHEHTLAGLQTHPLHGATSGAFVGEVQPDHPHATGPEDEPSVAALLAWAQQQQAPDESGGVSSPTTVFTRPPLDGADLDDDRLRHLVPGEWRHEERHDGTLRSFFTDDAHVVTAAKEAAVLRPHARIMRTGAHLTPDERTLTSTAWMRGVLASQVTQGHASTDVAVPVRRSYLGLFTAMGVRALLQVDGVWRLLDAPSLWSVDATGCTWWWSLEDTMVEARVSGGTDHVLSITLSDDAQRPVALAVQVCGPDDGADPTPLDIDERADGLSVLVPTDRPTVVGGRLHLRWKGTARAGRDEVLTDGRSCGLPWVSVLSGPDDPGRLDVELRVDLHADPETPTDEAQPWELTRRQLHLDGGTALGEYLPWLADDALVHYLSPRGIEQFTGGAWGTRDVCQGPVGLLTALDEPAAMRDVVLRTMRAQHDDGSWPQWFDYLDRHRSPQYRSSHGDVVYWPLLALGHALLVGVDPAVLHDEVELVADGRFSRPAPVLDHVERALAYIDAHTTADDRLPAYGHGDWNDSLQPADPRLPAHMCSSWTAVLQVVALRTLAEGLEQAGDPRALVDGLRARADATVSAIEDSLLVDGELAGYALIDDDGSVSELLVHPRDQRTGLRHGILAPIHAISAQLFTPETAEAHLAIIHEQLHGPDGARLFDAPPPYRGGPMEVFQRAEAATFWGREIGLMYTHAHLRFVEALAALGRGQEVLDELERIVPIGLVERVPQSRPRQSNTYASSSDAAFTDREDAAARYPQLMAGEVALEAGWRVYSSGPGLFLQIVREQLLGVRRRGEVLELDPVVPHTLTSTMPLLGRHVTVVVEPGTPSAVLVNGEQVASSRLIHRYRTGGLAVRLTDLQPMLHGDDLVVVQARPGA